MFHALGYGLKLVAGGLAAILHAIIPAFFQTTASTITAELYEELQSRLAKAEVKRDASQKSF
jgi:hypothetical protein